MAPLALGVPRKCGSISPRLLAYAKIHPPLGKGGKAENIKVTASTGSGHGGRSHIGIYTLQSGSFPAILRQKATAGISLAVAFYLVLQKNSLFGVIRSFEEEIFSHRESRGRRNTECISRRWIFCGEKDSFKTV